MSYKVKSVLYFASLVLAITTYYHCNNSYEIQTTELTNNSKYVSNTETLK